MTKNKKILYIVLGAVAVVAITLGLIFKNNGSPGAEVTCNNPEFSNYVSAYTSGVISKKATIKVKLLSQVAKNIKEEDKKKSTLIKISPSAKGEVKWIDNTTIEFKPKEELKSSQVYQVDFNIGKLVDKLPKDLKHFTFNVQTIKQNFDITIDELTTTDRKTLKWQRLTGSLQMADYEDLKSIKKMIDAKLNGNKIPVKWETKNNIDYLFTIDSIERTNQTNKLEIAWNGSKINVEKQGDLQVEIPALGDFKLISTRIIHGHEQYLQLQFSDPLKENQNLKGIIKIGNYFNLRYIIDNNIVKVFPPSRLTGSYSIKIAEGIQNILGTKLKEKKNIEMIFEVMKPSVRMVGDGVILPSSKKGLVMPFEAVNLKAVDVRVIKIYENNVTQFLQVNNLSGDYQLKRVGKPIMRKTISLEDAGIMDLGNWNRFHLNLNELIEPDMGAIYRIEINFRKQHSLYTCSSSDIEDDTNLEEMESNWSIEDEETSNWDTYDDYYDNEYSYYYGDYWENRDNPCHDAYYGRRQQVAQNIIASDIGIIAKKGNDNSMNVVISDLTTTNPLAGVDVQILDYQQQILKTATTDGSGIVNFEKVKNPYFIVAKSGNHRGYLKIDDGQSLSLSRFDISGSQVQKGLKGFIYGERGVWRPGDSIFLTFILQENAEPLPEKHPIIFNLKNPSNQEVYQEVKSKSKDGFYSFKIKTDKDAPTGSWLANVQVGGVNFSKYLRIETIKPNRLKINIDFGEKSLKKGTKINGELAVKWLHGAVAKDLKAQVNVTLSKSSLSFPKYDDFTFEDPTKSYYSESDVIFSGKIDENGKAAISSDISTGAKAPGKLKATFVTRVYEKSGDFSIDQFSLPYYSYTSFIGLKLPKGDKARGMLLTDTTHKVEMVILDADGKPVNSSHQVEVSFYKIKWRWWWDKSNYDLINFNTSSSTNKIASQKLMTKNGKAEWAIKVEYPEWGRYLVYAKDLTSGHTTAKVVYIDWPGWAGRARKDSEGAAMLSFSSQKKKYNIGEEIELTIPTAPESRALVSIENGSKVIENYWVVAQGNESKFKFKATSEMTPNIFVNVTMIQPHSQTANDLPIRLYGVIPISIEDPETHLKPKLEMPDELQAEKPFKVTVSEENNKPMTYTIAVVDEGLLDLTRFNTPEPWNTFYAREALGVKTWDIYDYVIGAYSGRLEKLLNIGGGDEEGDGGNKSANRFKPVVKFYGPYHLKRGSKTHTIQLPQYIGSVRTMVVAGYQGAYGSVEKATPVIKPLMLLGTMPRVLGPGEKLSVPVTVFAMKDNIKNVEVSITTNDLINVTQKTKKQITFDKPGEQIVYFDIEVKKQTGVAKVQFVAKSGGETSAYDIELDVRNPNTKQTNVLSKVLNAGETWNPEIMPVGILGTNSGVIEMSSIPPLNLEKRLKYLISYPHGCIEQTTSSVFPQLFVSNLTKLTDEQKDKIAHNIKEGIKRMATFQNYDGGFGYWPNSSYSDEWGSCYAGHFLLEAKSKGYSVPNSVLNKWKKYQSKKADNFYKSEKDRSQLVQAYRLYTLALANKPNRSAMNRLKESKNISSEVKWRLAAAYQLDGKSNTAQKLIESATTVVTKYKELSNTYGSDLRDKAMILETLTLLGMKTKAFEVLQDISEQMASNRWLSTQTTAYSLIAISQFVGNNGDDKSFSFSYKVDNEKEAKIKSKEAVVQNEIPIKMSGGKISITNTSAGVIYARVILEGVPEAGEENAAQNNLKIAVDYMGMDGQKIDPTQIPQGTDFVAQVKVSNPTSRKYEEIALTQIFPSGWEIINTRMFNIKTFKNTSKPEYQDIRDDRVYTYFDLEASASKTFHVILNAGYQGNYYLPPAYVEAMYDASINARNTGQKVTVTRTE